jgi:hypothetical protein
MNTKHEGEWHRVSELLKEYNPDKFLMHAIVAIVGVEKLKDIMYYYDFLKKNPGEM